MTRRKYLQALAYSVFFIALTMVITACINLNPVTPPPQQQYVINQLPAPTFSPAKHTATTLLVSPMASSEFYNSKRMVYLNSPHQIQYFAYAHWVDLPTHMLQPLLVQTLQQSGRYRAVVTPPFIGTYERRLDTTLLYLAQEFNHDNTSQVRVILLAEWINMTTQKVVAVKKFEVVEPAPEATPYGGVVAANRACAKLLRQLVI